jgi:hypothetical protein
MRKVLIMAAGVASKIRAGQKPTWGAMKRHRLILFLVVCLTGFNGCLVSENAAAQSRADDTSSATAIRPPDQSQPPALAGDARPFTTEMKSRLTVSGNRTVTQISTRRIKMLSPGVIQALSQQQVQFVEGMQKLETLEAFTEKADGRRVQVDPSNIITRDAASGLQATYASDLKIRTFIFPDVAVGDTLVLTIKADIRRDFFAGQLTDFDVFPRSQSVTSVQYIIEAPANLDLAVGAGNGASDKTEVVGGIRRHVIEVTGASYRPDEPGAVSPFDREPYVALSTFHSYAKLGAAYGREALPQSKLTPEISALADQITRGITDRRAQAAAIDTWVKSNIRYVAVYLSLGRVVPHDAATVLRNGFGDCKDKVTLMSALLAARGIASEQVLVNLGPAYSLPEPPTLAVLNHAIIYLPEFDLYDDPTASFNAFATLSAETYDKPVVRVSADGATLARTPAMNPQAHTARVKTTVQFAADGTVSGQTEESGTGILAGGLRSAAATLQQAGQETVVERKLQSVNTPGTGHYELGSSAELRDPAVIKSDFKLNDRFKPPAPTVAVAIPGGMPFSVRPGSFTFGARLNGRQSAFACLAGIQIEDIEAVFDPALPMPIPPTGMTIDNPLFTYRSSYGIENRTLKIHREFVSRVSRQVCPAEAEAQITPDLNKVRADLYSGFRFAALTAPPRLQVSEVARAIAPDQPKQVDFFYDIGLDCSPSAFPAISTIEPPRHGRISADRESGTSNFPQSNPRFACNRYPTQGMTVTYQPERGFTGNDTATVDVLYADKSVTRRRYAFNVGPGGEAVAKLAQIVEVSRVAARDQTLQVASLYYVNPDCSVMGIPAVRIVEPSKNGNVTFEKGTVFPTFPATNSRAKCNDNSVDGELIFYMPQPGYLGADAVTVEIIYPDGTASTRRYAIEVK